MTENKRKKRGSHFLLYHLSLKDIVERNTCKSILESVREV
jgi:hypothetical protein